MGDRKNEDTEGENHDRIETLVGQLHLTHKGNRHLAKGKAHDRADNNLDNDFLCNLQGTDRGRMGCDNTYEGDGEYIRHGIVGARLQLQQGTKVVLEPHPIGTKDGEDTCRVGGRHGGGNEKRRSKSDRGNGINPAQYEIDNGSRDKACEHDTDRCQCATRSENRAYVGDTGIHTSGEEDDTKRDSAHCLCGRGGDG